MKKLVLFFAVIVAVSFASCGKKTAPAADVTVDSTATVAAAADTTVAAAADTTVAAPAE